MQAGQLCLFTGTSYQTVRLSLTTTCQGRDLMVTFRSGEGILVVVNVHFEPDPVLRDLRQILRLFSLHWPRDPEAFAMIVGAFKGRFNVRDHIFTEGDTEKPALVRSYFPHVREVAQANFTRKDSSGDGTLRILSRIDRAFINLPMAEARDFHCYSRVSDNLGERSIPSDHVAVRVVIQKSTIRCGGAKRSSSWTSKHPMFCSTLKRISESHQYFGCAGRIQSNPRTWENRPIVISHATQQVVKEPSF